MKRYASAIGTLGVCVVGSAIFMSIFLTSSTKERIALGKAEAEKLAADTNLATLKGTQATLAGVAKRVDAFITEWEPIYEDLQDSVSIQRRLELIASDRSLKAISPSVAEKSIGVGKDAQPVFIVSASFQGSGNNIHNAIMDLEKYFAVARVDVMRISTTQKRDATTLEWSATIPNMKLSVSKETKKK